MTNHLADQKGGPEDPGQADSEFGAALKETPPYTFIIAAVAALGGILFGYDIGVISGAEKLLTADFHLSSTGEEIAVASVLIGAIIGGLIGGKMANRFSRRWSLMAMAILYGVGAIVTTLAWNLDSFIAFRIITGLAVGASSLIVPSFIGELAPAPIRGGLVVLQQLAISGGILLSYVVDFLFKSFGWSWRPMFGFAVIPAAVLAIGMLFMSYSPRWLGMQGRWREAAAVLERVNPRHKDAEMKLMRAEIAEEKKSSWRELLQPGLRGALIAGIGLAIFQQLVGPNTVLFYTPTIFGYADVGGNSLLPTIYVGAVLFIFVFPTIAFVDVIGRKKLFYIGLIGMASMLLLLGLAFDTNVKSWGIWVLVVLLVYVACYSLSISPLFWLMTAELFPNRLRGAGASAATTANWAANLVVSVTFLTLINVVGKSWTFWLYAGFAVLGIGFVARFVPETKGRPLEYIGEYWTNGHHWPTGDSADDAPVPAEENAAPEAARRAAIPPAA
jgi:SP family galactose:H+ symporter-like MFS transporter